jgi:amino acid transporter
MPQSLSAQRLAAVAEGEHALPAHRWHPKGYKISIISSVLMTVAIVLFFILMADWSPSESWRELANVSVTWILLTYIWVQMGSLILVGAGTKNQMWLDALTSIIPLFAIVYVILQHHSGYVLLSPFQAKTAWVTAYTMLLDVVVDLGVSVLLSRQVVDVGGAGVA